MNAQKYMPTLVMLGIVILAFGARWSIGNVYSAYSAQVLLDSLRNASLYIGSACLGGAATILALILTLVGLVRRADDMPDRDVYADVLKVARNATWTLVASIVLLLLLTGPTSEMEELPKSWYPTLYNILFGAVALTLATLAATIMRLYLTIACILRVWAD